MSLGATAHPIAEWIARQLIEACGWDRAPRYVVRDRDSVYGEVFMRRLRTMGIRDRPTAPRSPWQNGHSERLIGAIRRECLTMSWCSVSATFAMCSHLMRLLIIKPACTYRSTRMRRSLALSRLLAASPSTTNPGRIASSLCPDLVSDRDSTQQAHARRARGCSSQWVAAARLGIMRDPFIAREPNTMSFCRPSKLFAFQVLMCGSSCRTTFNNELWTSNPVPL